MKRRSLKVLGVGLALLVPALAVAVTVPHGFEPNTAIYAADMNDNFNALEAAVNELDQRLGDLADLEQRLGDLEEADRGAGGLALGPRTELAQVVTPSSWVHIFNAPTDGVVYGVPGGTGYTEAELRGFVGSNLSFTNWSSASGGRRHALSTNGATLMLVVRAGEEFAISGDFPNGSPSVALWWVSLTGDGSIPTPTN